MSPIGAPFQRRLHRAAWPIPAAALTLPACSGLKRLLDEVRPADTLTLSLRLGAVSTP